MGVKYTRGIEVTQDYGRAARLFEQAAEQGHAKAQTALAFAYHLGRGVPKSDAEAAKWFRGQSELMMSTQEQTRPVATERHTAHGEFAMMGY